ncbi:MAG: hypothetical protein ABI294_08010, partial [Casimicrobiaceae bacterium]
SGAAAAMEAVAARCSEGSTRAAAAGATSARVPDTCARAAQYPVVVEQHAGNQQHAGDDEPELQ